MITSTYMQALTNEIKNGVDRASLADIDTQSKVDIVERDLYALAAKCIKGEFCGISESTFQNIKQSISNAFYLGFSRGYKYGYRMGNGEINIIPLKYEPKEITQNEAGDIRA